MMNQSELIKEIATRTGVDEADCRIVLDALEDVLEENLAASGSVGGAVDKIYNLIGFLRGKKRDGNE